MNIVDYWVIGIGLLMYAPSAFQLLRISRRDPHVTSFVSALAVVGMIIGTILLSSVIFEKLPVGAIANTWQEVLLQLVVSAASIVILITPLWLVLRARERWDRLADL